MSRPIAGSRRPQQDTLTIDYADVLRQAVENERHHVLRLVRQKIAAVPKVDERRGDSWNRPARPVPDVVRDILAAIDRLEDEA